MFDDAHTATCSPYAKFKPDWSINQILVAKTTSCVCGYDNAYPLPPPHVVNNAHLGVESIYQVSAC